jgi:hypothetical protein
MIPGLARKFMEPPIKALVVLQCLSVILIKYKEKAGEIKEVLSTLMDQHRFPYENTCEDFSSSGWNMIEIIHCSERIR